MDNIDTRPKKTVADSKTETTRTILYKDINGSNRLFGGRLMEWIDETSGITERILRRIPLPGIGRNPVGRIRKTTG